MIISRVKPQLVRKRDVIQLPKTVKIVVQPSNNRTISLQQARQLVKQDRTKVVIQQPSSINRHNIPINGAVSQKNNLQKRVIRKTQLQYATPSVSLESIAKVKSIRGIGNNRILAIIGNGPSILEVELDKLKNHPKIDTLSINKPDNRLWPTTYWAFFDVSQIRRHEGLWNNYEGMIFNSTSIKRQKSKSMQFKNIGGKGFSKDALKGIHIGRSSVFAAMQIALWMGYEKVYIFGCDMNPDGLNGKLHFYGDNPDVQPDIRRKRFKDEATYYSTAATILTKDECDRFVFCTLGINPWSFLEQFQSLKHTEAIDSILQYASK